MSEKITAAPTAPAEELPVAPQPTKGAKRADFIDHPRDAEHVVSNAAMNVLPDGVKRDAPATPMANIKDVVRAQQAKDREAAHAAGLLTDDEKKKADDEASARAAASKAAADRTKEAAAAPSKLDTKKPGSKS